MTDLKRFYALIERLATLPGQGRRLAESTGRMQWPSRGVYFFQEPGEYRKSAPGDPRIVRVGTHAVSTGAKSTLWSRLRAHRGGMDLGGNHRASIFRLHVGAALLERDKGTHGRLPTWSIGQSAPRGVRQAEADHERRVSQYIGRMSVLWVDVPDDPGPNSRRSFIERNAIALLSNRLSPQDGPSESWLGRYSPRAEIRQSGLWNLNHVVGEADSVLMDELETAVELMRSSQQESVTDDVAGPRFGRDQR
jgi:hypothetical protein